MSPKEAYYAMIVTRLASLWEQDARMSEEDSETWQQARALDDALVATRADLRVSAKDYRVHCVKLLELYELWTPKAQGAA
jgi:hypothetical protein